MIGERLKPPFEWDSFSNQPKVIFDKTYKRRLRSRYWTDYIKMAATAAGVLPIAAAHLALKSRPQKFNAEASIPKQMLGMGTNLDKGPQQFDLIDELGIDHVLIRIPLWEMERLGAYQAFAQGFHNRGKTVLINVLQDREHIEQPRQLAEDLHRIFDAFAAISGEFQIGNAINRVKWGFFAVEEYLRFYQIAQRVRDRHFCGIELLGPAVIDFEYHVTARALFNNYNLQFDRLSALLYVDRMGAPENKQYGLFDANRKMRLLGSLAALSSKVKHKGAYITEANWPLKGTAPYAPTSEKECVSEAEYATFMQSYLRIAAQSGCIDRVYWHQLIAPGYGLIDDRGELLRKTLGFAAWRSTIACA